MKKILIILGVLLIFIVLLLGSVGVWAYYEFLYTEPLSEAELVELTTDWDVITDGNWSPWFDPGDGVMEWNPAASYNAWVSSIPEDERAWPALVDAYYTYFDLLKNDAMVEYMGTLPTDPERWSLLVPELVSSESDALLDELLHAFERPEMGAWLSKSTDPFEHAAWSRYVENQPEPDGGERPMPTPGPLDFDPQENVELMSIPRLSRITQRQSTNFMRSKGAYELEQGDSANFIATVRAMLRSSDMASDLPTIIGALTELAIEHATLRMIDWALLHHGDAFDDAALQQIDDALAVHTPVRFIWQGEAIAFNDALRRLGDANGRLKPGSPAGSGSPTNLPDAKLHPSSQHAILVHNRVLRAASEQAGLDWDGTSGQIDAVYQRERASLNSVTAMMLGIALPALDRTPINFRQVAQQTVGTRLAIAAYRHRARHGDFPESLDAIGDDLIDFDLIDAFTGDPLRYRLVDGYPLIYSLGDDRTDDGGQIRWEYGDPDVQGNARRIPPSPEWFGPQRAAELRLNVPERIVGDWVLFPIPRADPKPLEYDYDGDWDLHQDGSYEDVYGEETGNDD